MERGSEQWTGSDKNDNTGNAVPKKEEAVAITVKTVEEKDGGTTAKVTKKGLKDAIADAKQSGTDIIWIEPDVKGKDKVTVELPKDLAQEIVNQTNAALQVKTEHTAAIISQEGLKDLTGCYGNTVSVTVEGKAKGKASGTRISVAVDGREIDKIAGGLLVTVPAARESAGNVLILTAADGRETVLRKSVSDGKNVRAVVNGSSTVKAVDNGKGFADTQDHWAKDAVAFVTSRGLFNGTSGSSFSPDCPMTWAMMAAVLYRLEDGTSSGSGVFTDVKPGGWCADAVAWASGAGIVTGYNDGRFQPNRSVNREQMAAMLYRYAKSQGMDSGALDSLSGFHDGVKVSPYAADAVKWAAGNGLIDSKADGRIDPSGNVTRAQAAALLQRLVERMARQPHKIQYGAKVSLHDSAVLF